MGPVRDVDDLMAAGHGYQRAMILFAALKLGVFRGLAGRKCDASALARRVGADPGKLSILLDALAAQGLLAKKGKRYRNAKVARDHLLPGPRSMESILLHHLDGWGVWGRLSATVRAGRTPRGGADGDWQENFIRGMEENSRERAAAVAERILLPIANRVGGDQPELRAALAGSQIVGLATARHLIGLEPLARASRAELARALAPVIDHYLRGDWLRAR